MDRLQRLSDVVKETGLDVVLLTAPGSVKSFSGYGYNFETGPSPFHVLPAIVVIVPAHNVKALLVADSEADKTTALLPGVQAHTYSSYTYGTPLIFENDFYAQVRKLAGLSGGSAAVRIGVEINSLPHGLYQALAADHPNMVPVDLTAQLQTVKAVKDADEVEHIRSAAKLADIGQAAVLKYAKVGMTELELFSKVRLEMELAAGTRVPMMTDLVSGVVTASGGGNPTDRIIGRNDLILSDLTPFLNGYWGDSCNTIIVGEPTVEQIKIFQLVKESLKIGINAARPGVKAKEVDLAMRRHLSSEGNFGHHGGHGVGTVYHEEPRIVPYNDRVLEPGMVIALEPAIYKQTFGIRLEHLLLVTTKGPELLTRFEHRFTSH